MSKPTKNFTGTTELKENRPGHGHTHKLGGHSETSRSTTATMPAEDFNISKIENLVSIP